MSDSKLPVKYTSLIPAKISYNKDKQKPVKSRKHSQSRTPDKNKIGNIVSTVSDLLDAIDNKQSVVINNKILMPAISVGMWQFVAVIRLINNKSIRFYKKPDEKLN